MVDLVIYIGFSIAKCILNTLTAIREQLCLFKYYLFNGFNPFLTQLQSVLGILAISFLTRNLQLLLFSLSLTLPPPV